MVKYEAIFAVKERYYSHHSGNEHVYVPSYSIARFQFDAANKQNAVELARKEKDRIKDDFTSAIRLSLSTQIGLEPPRYEPF